MSDPAPHEPRDFLGVTPAVQLALGKVVIAAGLMENVADQLASALTRDTAREPLGRTLDVIRSAVDVGTPPWASAEPERVRDWCGRVANAANWRNKEFHAVRLQMASPSGDWLPIAVDLRDGRRRADDGIARLVSRLLALATEGQQILLELLVRLGPTVGMFPIGSSAAGIAMVFHGDDAAHPRPTDEQLHELWAQHAAAMVAYQKRVAAALPGP